MTPAESLPIKILRHDWLDGQVRYDVEVGFYGKRVGSVRMYDDPIHRLAFNQPIFVLYNNDGKRLGRCCPTLFDVLFYVREALNDGKL